MWMITCFSFLLIVVLSFFVPISKNLVMHVCEMLLTGVSIGRLDPQLYKCVGIPARLMCRLLQLKGHILGSM